MKVFFILLLSGGLLSHEVWGQKKFTLCPKHPFKVIDGDLHNVLDDDFAVNGRDYPTIAAVSDSSIIVVNPFVDEKDVLEIFSRRDSTSSIAEFRNNSIKLLLTQLNLQYSAKSVVKQLNFSGKYRYFVYANPNETCQLIQFDTLTLTYKICASFNNTLEISRTSGSIYFFQGLDKIVIYNMMIGQSVIVDLDKKEVYYIKNPSGFYAIGIFEDSILEVDESSCNIYKLSYLSPLVKDRNMRLVLHYPKWNRIKPSFFFDYLTTSLYVYSFDFQKFCISGNSYIIR